MKIEKVIPWKYRQKTDQSKEKKSIQIRVKKSIQIRMRERGGEDRKRHGLRKKNKAAYATASVAYGWAGAVMRFR